MGKFLIFEGVPVALSGKGELWGGGGKLATGRTRRGPPEFRFTVQSLLDQDKLSSTARVPRVIPILRVCVAVAFTASGRMEPSGYRLDILVGNPRTMGLQMRKERAGGRGELKPTTAMKRNKNFLYCLFMNFFIGIEIKIIIYRSSILFLDFIVKDERNAFGNS